MKKHAYLIMAHGQMDVLRKLIEELDYEWNDIYIHIDIKVGKISIKELTRNIKKSKIYFVKRMSVVWGGSSLIKCEMRLLKEAAKNEYRYFHYLSGVDFPIKTQKQIHEFFDLHDGKEFIEFWERDKADFEYRIKYYYPLQEKIGRYTFDLKTLIYRIKSKLMVFFQWMGKCNRLYNYSGEIKIGSNWVSITDDFAKYLLNNEALIGLLFGNGVAADELFMQTLCWNSKFREKIYEGGPVRLIDWRRGNPYIWRELDIEEIRNSKCLFVRKVSGENALIDIIHNDLQENG